MRKYLIVLTFICTLSGRGCLEVNSKSLEKSPKGISNNERIIGGDSVEIHLHPHQISLRGRKTNGFDNVREHFCGGSIISSTIIITAAHCVINKAPSQLFVAAGSNKRSGSDSIITFVKEIVAHEKYDPSMITNDIALLIVSPPLPLNNFTMKSIELDENVAPVNALATVTGWGRTEYEEKPEILKQVQMPIIDNDVCMNDYKAASWSISDDQVCAGFRGIGGKGSCFMDSGGPLTINGKLVGIVSYGQGCGLAEFPGVYARVSYHMQWIRKKIALYQKTLHQ